LHQLKLTDFEFLTGPRGVLILSTNGAINFGICMFKDSMEIVRIVLGLCWDCAGIVLGLSWDWSEMFEVLTQEMDA
jgi:hypothetical protein